MEIDAFYLFVAGEIGIGILLMQSWVWVDKVFQILIKFIVFPALIIFGVWSAKERFEQNKLLYADKQKIKTQIRLESRLKEKVMSPEKTVRTESYGSETIERLVPIEELIEGRLRGKIL